MRIRSLFLGQRPSVPAWAGLFFLLFVAGLGAYAAAVPQPVLPASTLGLVSVAGELVCRAVLAGELTRILLFISRDSDISRLTIFCIGLSLLAMSAVAATFELQPGSFNLVASGVGVAAWFLAHRVISAQLYLFQDLEAYNRGQSSKQALADPLWLQQLRAKIESDPSYHDQH